ncbi:ABC transporter permease subunit [Pseudomonas saxonica]|uniref:ABC transporter permease subunit n=1 Tax=Pseudomonas saxonica TaxID=2600598 RepID=A0A5C5PXU8_9PSED|nr:ABC transporter permease subunit [Pseudomonas saxonica]
MTDTSLSPTAPLSVASSPASETAQRTQPIPPIVPRFVRMRSFGIGKQSTARITLFTGLLLMLGWWYATEVGLTSSLFLPSPGQVLTLAREIVVDGYANATLWEHLAASLTRILSAGAIAISIGIPLGLLMGLNRWAKGIFDAPIEFYWPLPPLAYLPLMIIWLGIGETSKITLLTLAMLAPIILSAQAGVRALPMERVNAALSLGASRWQLFSEIVLPSALPEILTGIRISLSLGWGTLVAAELIASTKGIGFMIMSASHFLATDAVFVGIFVIALCAFAFSFGMRLLESWLVPWKGKQ